jgi:hypothetical protein
MSNRFKLDRFKFVNKDGISTDEMREMVDKYLVLNATEKDTIKQQLGCQSMNDLDFLTYIRQNSLHRKFMTLLGM